MVLESKVDRNGIDALIKPIMGATVQIDIQMKSTRRNIRIRDDELLSYQLDIGTYDKLRRTDVQSPQILVIFEMPADERAWLSVRPPTTTLRHAAYWADLRGKPAVAGDSVAVHVPVAQLFDENAIVNILRRTHARALEGLAWA